VSGRIPQHFIEELIARADIVELIGSRVPLKKHGKEFKACCPFHGEKTPSFTVVPDKQFYHCFGCGAHGTALGFLMDHDHLSFVEAIEELAARAGLEVPRDETYNAPAPNQGQYTVLERATRLYGEQLARTERGRAYFKSRGLTAETATNFELGYAPDAWDFLLRQLGEVEEQRKQLLQAGLIIERERKTGSTAAPGHYDRFRDRVMFPIRDARGRTIGFGGRVLDRGEPKYLNSPETELFHKGRELYGLYEARRSSRTLNRLLVVEGYMDVVRLHQAGLTYAVATLGTATTTEHLTRVFRICNELIFCFDGDRAGRAAAWRALENSLPYVREGRQLRFLFLPDGHDPDSLVGEEGREAFEARLSTATPLSEYLLAHLAAQADLSSVDGRAQFAELARPLLEKIPAGIYRELLSEEIARKVQLDSRRLATALQVDGRSMSNHETSLNPALPLRPNLTSATSAGRGGIVRQAVRSLVHHPAVAAQVEYPQGLENVNKPGIPLLVELLNELQARPCNSYGALLERWRGRPDEKHLSKLHMEAQLLNLTESQARAELSDALERLLSQRLESRVDELIQKNQAGIISAGELAELKGLLPRVNRITQ
jgi:DNA primase